MCSTKNNSLEASQLQLNNESQSLYGDRGLPIWEPLNFVQIMDSDGLLKANVQRISSFNAKGLQNTPQDIANRLKETFYGRFYIKYLKRINLIQAVVSKLWRNLLPIYINTSAFLLSRLLERELKEWRDLVRLIDFPKDYDVVTHNLVNSEIVTIPTPVVFPEYDQSYLETSQNEYLLPEIFVSKISNGTIYGGTNLTLVNNKVICHDLYDFKRDYTSEELHGRTLINPNKNMIRWLVHDKTPEKISQAASFVDACAPNYAHWLTEVLSRIVVFCSNSEFHDIPIVVNDRLHKNIMESLFLVAGQERPIITLSIGRALQVNELYITSVAGYVPFEQRNNKLPDHSHGIFCRKAFILLQNQLSAYSNDLPKRNYPDKIYVRRNSNVRNLSNASELEASLIPMGYVAIEPEKMSFLEQFQIFRNANEVVSPTGAALANAIFCRPGTKICVLMAKHPKTIYRYWLNMLSPLMIDVSYVLCDIIEKYNYGVHSNFHVNIQNVVKTLNSWKIK